MAGAHIATNPSKAHAERYYLWYTPIWGIAAGLVMTTGLAENWGDARLMAFGVVLWLGLLLPPFFWRAPGEKGRPWYTLYHCKIQLWMFLFAFLGNYFGTAYFYEVLHMHYGFQTHWNVNNVPFFLYFLTVVYFTTYCVLLNMAYRWLRGRIPSTKVWLRRLALIPAALAVAGLESALNANPFMKKLFCYDDLPFMLWFGTLVYGMWFVITLPIWFRIDEQPTTETSLQSVVVGVLAAFMLIICGMELTKHVIAPIFTTVQPGAIGLRDVVGSCLQAR